MRHLNVVRLLLSSSISMLTVHVCEPGWMNDKNGGRTVLPLALGHFGPPPPSISLPPTNHIPPSPYILLSYTNIQLLHFRLGWKLFSVFIDSRRGRSTVSYRYCSVCCSPCWFSGLLKPILLRGKSIISPGFTISLYGAVHVNKQRDLTKKENLHELSQK